MYKFPILMAIFFFPFLALLLSMPFLIYHYRKYGSVSFLRTFIVFSFFFYLLCTYFLVILPLPSIKSVASYKGPYYNLRPFTIVNEVMTNGSFNIKDINTYHFLLNDFSFIEKLFNIFMLIPFGVYLRYYFKRNFLETLIFSFWLSLFFEITQLTGLYFIYPRPYRLCDVNDLINNTMGGCIGFIITPIFSFILPSREKIDHRELLKSENVTIIKRLVALIIDYFIIIIPSIIWAIKFRFIYFYLIISFIYFVIIPCITRGYTLGKWLLYIKIDDSKLDGSISFIKLVFRWITLHILIINSFILCMKFYHITKKIILIYVLFYTIIFTYILYCMLFKKRLFYDKILKLNLISVFGVDDNDEI